MLTAAIFCAPPPLFLFLCKHRALQFPTAHLHNASAATIVGPRALCERRRHVAAVRETKGRRRGDVPGIKTRRRHCWEERPQNATGNICPGESAAGAGGNADRRAENFDFDGAREQTNAFSFLSSPGVENRSCQGLLFLFTLCVKM